VFQQLGQPEKALQFIRLDAGSEYAAMETGAVLLGQGKLGEAKEVLQRASNSPFTGRDLLQSCLDPYDASRCERAAHNMERAAMAAADVEVRYSVGALLSYCRRTDAAIRLLNNAIEHNYCAYMALQTDPLLVNVRGTPEFRILLSSAKRCQGRFLAQRSRVQNQSLTDVQ
jgi:predicted negative regulator of RcsB-dependent stress response